MTASGVGLALSLVFGALVSEDLALLSAVGLVEGGALPAVVGYGAAAMGIFVGDLGLYLIGRASRRRSFEHAPDQGSWTLTSAVFFARFVPGARVAAYLAAGAGGMPTIRFVGVTALALVLWVGGAAVLGAAFFEVVADAAPFVLTAVAVALVAVAAWRWWRSPAFRLRVRKAGYRVLRWKHHEFWPMWFFYPPVALYGLYLAVRHRSATALLHVNPGMPTSGIIGESKADILRSLPADHAAMLPYRTLDPEVLRSGGGPDAPTRGLRAFMLEAQLEYPIILKPDVGQRGSGVRVVRSDDDARAYLDAANFAVVAQAYCAWPEEAGINYVRDPDQRRGRITGITRKRFPAVIGDGRRTLTELVLDDPRARLIADTYLERHRTRADTIIPVGELVRLVEAGNHCQGAIFQDGEALITPELEAAIDGVARQIPGFYAGRFDVRFASEEGIRRGEDFKIIELNGAAGEATHIYDADKTVFDAYRILFDQLDDLYRVGRKNERRGHRAPTGLLRALWDFRIVARAHPPTT